MKKTLSILLSLLLVLCPLLSASASKPFDLEYIQNSEYMKSGLVYLEERDSATYLYNNFSVEDVAISFAQESDEYYSYVDFDIGIFDEDGVTLPILRLWFTLWTDEKSYDIDSLTVYGHRCQYTFSNLYRENFFKEDEGDVRQDVVILFDFNSLQCLSELMRLRALVKASTDYANTGKIVFHGTEDLTYVLDDHFWNIFDVYLDLYLSSNGSVNLGDYEGTPMEMAPLS